MLVLPSVQDPSYGLGPLLAFPCQVSSEVSAYCYQAKGWRLASTVTRLSISSLKSVLDLQDVM